ncbi:MAG: DUF3857 domain-containing protein [Acidobacteriota bacterium]|nr:DUF3857 domain-containing protein [Acidobacteriota bacterium]
MGLVALWSTVAIAQPHEGDATPPWDLPPNSVEAEALRHWASTIVGDADAGVQVLYRGLTYRLDEEGRSELDYRLIYRVQAATHVDAWSRVSQTWHPWHQDRPDIQARVISTSGEERWLDQANVGEFTRAESTSQIYDDTRTLAGPLPAVDVGSIVEEHHIVRDKLPYYAAGTVRRTAVAISAPVHFSRIVVEAPIDAPLHHVIRGLDHARVTTETADRSTRKIVEIDGIDAWKDAELFSPAEIAVRPYVGFSTGESWNTIATSYDAIVDRQLGDSSKLVEATADLTSVNRRAVIDESLAWVHSQVRYTGVEFGERALIPSTPEETLARQFGDCKDKSALLVSRLRGHGIAAHLALLLTGPGPDIDPALPGIGDFNHAIVYVPGDEPLWIDPTDPFSRAGEVPLPDQGRLALVASGISHTLLMTPNLGSRDNRIIETRDVTISPNGPGTVVETTEWFGSFDGEYRGFFSEVQRERLVEHFNRYVQAAYSAETLGELILPDTDRLDKQLSLRLEALKASWVRTRTTRATVTIPTGPLFDELPPALFPTGDDTPRKHDFVFSRPHTKQWSYRIQAPPGYDALDLPDDLKRPFGPLMLTETYRRDEGGVVHASFELDTGARVYTADEVEQFRTAYLNYGEEEAAKIVFEQIGERQLAHGDVGPALQTFRELLRDDPDEPIHHTRIARALLTAGLGDEARRHARIASRMAADSPEVHKTLGLVLAHDALGRKFHAGFDRDGAERALRRSLSLNPEDVETRGELAILLEHNLEGVRYGRGADLEQAIEEYRTLGPALESLSLKNNLRVALMQSEQFEELRDLTEGARGPRPETVHHIISIAALQGSEEAIRIAARRTSSAEHYRQLLVSASELLPLVRRYRLAGDLLAAGARGETQSVSLLPRVAMLRRSVRHEELDTNPATPEGLLRGFLVDVLASDRGGRDAMEHLHPVIRERLDERTDAGGFFETIEALRSGLGSASAPSDVTLDIALSNGEILREGDRDDGFKLRFRLVLPEQAPAEFQAFVAHDGKRYRLVEFGRPTVVGYYIERLIDSDRLETAARWLTWCLEEPERADPRDPLGGGLYQRFWSRSGSHRPERMRVAAALLMGDAAFAPRAFAILDRAWGSRQDTQRLDIDLAIASLAAGADDTVRWTRHAGNLYRAYPDSQQALLLWTRGLYQASDWEAAQRATERWLDRHPDDTDVIELASDIARNSGDRQTALDLLESSIRTGQANADIYNNIAWYHIMDGTITDNSLRWAQRSAMLDNFSDPNSLHTLATLYVETGRPAEARDVLLRLLETQPDEAPSASDWYIVGRIAESYGLMDSARTSYGKVPAPERATPLSASTYDMAQRRLRNLDRQRRATTAKLGAED